MNHFDLLPEEIICTISDVLPVDKKSFSLTCKWFYGVESKHRKNLKILGQENLSGILSRYPNIRSLDLSYMPITDECLPSIVKLQHLEDLVLEGCRVTDEGVGRIAVGCKKLRLISLKGCRDVGDFGVGLIAVNCKEIRSLDLSYMLITDECLPSIVKLQHLEDLVLEGCRVTDEGVGRIAVGCKKLRLISLKGCRDVGDFGVGLIAVNCKEIRSLNLSYMPITDECLPSILELPYLKNLVLEGCPFIDDEYLDALEHGCKSLKLSITERGNRRPNPLGAEPTIETAGWRTHFRPDWHERIVNKIMETLTRHLPFSFHERLNYLTKIARGIEEKAFTYGTSESDYLRKISLKMLAVESWSQNAV